MARIAVLDFGMGNLRSVAKALERAGASVEVTPEVPDDAGGLVVPGQGHFGSCVVNLADRAKDVVRWIERGRPYFGICLGLQILLEGSDEAPQAGLGVLPGRVRRLPAGLKIPHIGWNEVAPSANAPMLAGIDARTRFYFVHSYYPDPSEPSSVAATTEYGVEFCCAVARDNVWATQFHPEKSGDPGIALLRTFVERCR